MSKKKKPEAQKEEPKAKKPHYAFYPICILFGLILLNTLFHPGTSTVPSAPAPGPTLVKVEKLIWLPNDYGQKELYPIIIDSYGHEVILRNDKLRGGQVTTQTSYLQSPTSSDYRYTVP